MNKTTKKLIGGSLIVAILASIGAVLVSADTNEKIEDETPFKHFGFGKPMERHPSFQSELTEEQQEEIKALRETMEENDASTEEIRDAINEKLRDFGIEIPTRDETLDTKIEQTTQRLEILERQKELREQGYSWDEISDVISEEFDIEFPENHSTDKMFKSGFHGARCRGGLNQNFKDNGDSDI